MLFPLLLWLPLCMLSKYAQVNAVISGEGIATYTKDIMNHQLSDGAIVMGSSSNSPSSYTVIPYVSNLAVIGLLKAYKSDPDPHILKASLNWLFWYLGHREPDGVIQDHTGMPGNWHGTGKADSYDSYAATWLIAASELVTYPIAEKDKLRLEKAVPQFVQVIENVMEPDGLTIPLPTYPVMYLMDNVEVYNGLKSAARLVQSLHPRLALLCMDMAARDVRCIDSLLWNSSTDCYRVGIQTDGAKQNSDLKNWYPDRMAQLMAIAWLPINSRRLRLYQKMKESGYMSFSKMHTPDESLEREAWWGMAALNSKDMDALSKIRRELRNFTDFSSITDPALEGHVCRILAR